MNKPKSEYSSNIITAIASIILLLGVISTVKFWVPFLSSANQAEYAKAIDPFKVPKIDPPTDADLKKAVEKTEELESEENYDPKP